MDDNYWIFTGFLRRLLEVALTQSTAGEAGLEI